MYFRKAIELALAVAIAMLYSGCESKEAKLAEQIGDLQKGRAVLAQYGCAACHAIPGVAGAEGKTGPSLKHFSKRDLYRWGDAKYTGESGSVGA
jgi:cytochrome c2